MDPKQRHPNCSGQAMAEFLVGLVCIMLLVVGLQQISFLSQKSFQAMNSARYQIAVEYMEDPPSQWFNFKFSSPTEAGPDGLNFTADDQRSGGDDSFYQDMDGPKGIDGYVYMVDDASIGDFYASVGRLNPHIDLNYSGGVFDTSPALHMMHAQAHATVEAVPFMDRVLGRDRILIGRELWMPRWNRIP